MLAYKCQYVINASEAVGNIHRRAYQLLCLNV